MARTSRKRLKPALASGLMLAPAVMMFRIPLLAAEASEFNPWRTETTRAMAEKAAAATEGMIGAQMALAHSAMSFWPEAMSGKVPSLLNGKAIQQAADAAMKPASRRVAANFRRLSARS